MKLKHLSDVLDAASKAYYEGNPIMSDEAFDKLAKFIHYSKIGYQSNSRDVKPHFYQMYSLKKYYKEDGEPPFKSTKDSDVVVSPKLDGAAIEHLYLNGKLTMTLTRGDGISGTDITEKFINSPLVPQFISYLNPVQISGEICAEKTIPNARNYASGALGLDDIEEFNKRKLIFVAYNVQFSTLEEGFGTYTKDMNYLREEGFKTVLDSQWENIEQDGLVFRLDSNKQFLAAGFTSKHPKGAYALKDKKEGEIAQIKEVIWETGKSGKVTPVAIITPVVIKGATITRVTLNNPGFIEELALDIGDYVEVIRAGDIIPCIVGKIEIE